MAVFEGTGDAGDLRAELDVLRYRVARLEQTLEALQANAAASGPPAAEVSPASLQATNLVASQPHAVPPGPMPQPAPGTPVTHPVQPRREAELSLENRIGSQIFNRVGVFAVLAAMAWFLKLAIDRNWIGPWPRVLAGLLVAAGLVVWSERFRSRGYVAFAHTLKALGTGIAYLALWTAFSVYHLLPAAMALLAMLAVTLANSILAWKQDSVLLAGYALAGGLATPALLWTGGNHELVLFSYLWLLDAAANVLARLRGWAQLVLAAFAGTVVYYTVWWNLGFAGSDRAMTGVFIALFFPLFAVAPGWLLDRTADGRWRRWLLALPAANGIAAYLAAERLLASANVPGQSDGWVGLAIAVAFALLLRVPRTGNRSTLWQVHAALAVGFFTLAVPLWVDGSAVALLWLAEAWALVWMAGRWPQPVLRTCALALLGLSALATLALPWTNPLQQPAAVLLNAHFATAVVACAVFGAAVWTATRSRLAAELNFVRALAAVLFSTVALVSVSVEAHHYWACGGRVGVDLCGAQSAGLHHEVYARFTYSAWYMLYGAGLMAAGFWRRNAFLRWQGLVLLTLSIGKVFLFDGSGLSSIYRVLSFLGLGVLLLAVSFAYQRDWLALRQGD